MAYEAFRRIRFREDAHALANVGPVPLLSAKGETPELRGAGLVQLATKHPKGGDQREWWGGPEAWPRQFPEVRR